MSKKPTTAEQYRKLTARKVNKKLWTKTKKLSKGSTKDKISAAELLFKEHYKLPKECVQIAKELADERQPLEVRIKIANNLIKYTNIPWGMYQPLFTVLAKSKNPKILNIISKSPIFEMGKRIQTFVANLTISNFYPTIFKQIQNFTILNFVPTIFKQIQEFTKSFDWEKFRKAYHAAMLRDLNSVKNDRITAVLGQVLSEYWLDVFIKNIFHNSKELLKFDFDKKRKILYGLHVLKSTTNNDLKKLNDIRNKYAHNFVVEQKEILEYLEKMNCYKNMTFGKNSKNNNRIKKCAIKLVSDLMDIEEQFIIEIRKKEKPKKK